MVTNKEFIEQLSRSELFRGYEEAFTAATGMPVALRATDSFDLPFQGHRKENAFCAMMSRSNGTCSGCLRMQDDVRRKANEKPCAAVCPNGLCEAAVPIRLGDRIVGFLQTGQVLPEAPEAADVERIAAKARQLGVREPAAEIKEAYRKTPVIPWDKLKGMVQLLASFGELLSVKSNEIAVQQANQEHPIVVKAKQYIQDQHAEDLSLASVAEAIHVSPFHLCKVFHKSTGMTFTEFVSRVRTERAKKLLLNPQMRVSEVVFEAGFQSLTHFNRIFKKLVGESPSRFRARVRAGHQSALPGWQRHAQVG